MSGRDPTDEECDELGWEILSLGRPESCRGVIRHFAREWQARERERCAEVCDTAAAVWKHVDRVVADVVTDCAARIREGRG